MDIIGNAWGFSVEILTGVTPSWKTELNRSIFACYNLKALELT